MTETPELEDAPAIAAPSPKRPDGRPSPPEAQPIPPTAEVDYLRPDGRAATGDTPDGDRRGDSASPDTAGPRED